MTIGGRVAGDCVMKTRLNWRGLLFVWLCCLNIGLTSVSAQAESCRALVAQALEKLGWHCADSAPGNACYGHDFVTATFLQQETFFNPADLAPAPDLLSLQTSVANLSTGGWGLVQINIPAANESAAEIEAQTGLRLLLLGDSELLDMEFARDAAPPSWRFRGEPQNAPCDEAANALLLNSARGLLMQVSMNGIQMDFDGSILARQPAVNIIDFLVVEGELVSSSLSATSGQVLSILLDEEGQAQAYIPTREASERERQVFTIVESALAAMRGEGPPPPPPEQVESTGDDPNEVGATPAPAEDADAVSVEETPGVEADDPPTVCEAGQTAFHTIETGETLFAIAQAYNSRVTDIASQNSISDVNKITAGTLLAVPCGTRAPGQTTMGEIPSLAETKPAADGDGCASLQLSASAAGEGMQTFVWQAVSGASTYTVRLWQGGQEIARYQSTGQATSLTGALPKGAEAPLTWSVEALQDTTVLCMSAAAPLVWNDGGDALPLQNPVPLAPAAVSWSCLSPQEIAVSWENLPEETDSLIITYQDDEGGRRVQRIALPGSQGRVVLAGGYTADGVAELTPQGTLFSLIPPEIYCG